MIDNVNESIGRAPKASASAPRIDAMASAGAEKIDPNGKMGQTNAPAASIFSILRSVSSAAAMSSKGSEYITHLKAKIADADAKHQIAVYTLSYPAMSMAFVSEGKAIVLLFSEAISCDSSKPIVSKVKDAVESLRNVVGPNVEPINCVVVSPDDYSKAEIMGAYVVNALTAAKSEYVARLNAASFRDVQVAISTVPDDYDKFIEMNNPHGVPARADLKLTISLVSPNRNNNSLWADEQGVKTPIAAVGAYVTFTALSVGNGMGMTAKFLPEVHISEITSLVWDDSILPLILSQATDCLIFGGFWKAQFNNINDNAPNIGSLIVDPKTNKTWKAENMNQRDQFIAQYCEQPILCLDVVEGRARIPGLVGWYMNERFPQISQKINHFLGVNELIPSTAELARPFYTEMTGTITTAGAQKADSRWIDFLNLMVHHEANRQQVMALLQHLPRPEDDVAVKRQFENSLSLLYYTTVVMIQPPILNLIRKGIGDTMRIINGRAMAGYIDPTYFATAGNGFMNGYGTGNNFGNYQNPFGQIWGNGKLF